MVRRATRACTFDSDVFLVEDGGAARRRRRGGARQVTRVEPEVYVPPLPGGRCGAPAGAERDEALFFDGMEQRLAARASRDGAADLRQPRVPRRHARRPRQHLRHLGRRHEDDLRDVPALRLFHSGALGAAGANTQGAHLQRQGRGPAVPRQAQRAASTPRTRHATSSSACPPARSSRVQLLAPVRRGLRARHARHRQPPGGRDRLLLDARASSAATACCASCSPRPTTSRRSSASWCSGSRRSSPPARGRDPAHARRRRDRRADARVERSTSCRAGHR